MTVYAAALAGMVFGVGHGLGPDHLAALGTLLADGADRRRTLAACLRFGGAHALVLAGLGAAAALSGWLVPESWEQAAEATGGALLVLLGATALARSAHVSLHRHSALLGGALALSGVRALALAIAPLLLAGRSLESALAFLIAFGIGVTVSMVMFGLLFHAGRRLVGRELTAVGLGGVSVLLGGWWIWSSLG